MWVPGLFTSTSTVEGNSRKAESSWSTGGYPGQSEGGETYHDHGQEHGDSRAQGEGGEGEAQDGEGPVHLATLPLTRRSCTCLTLLEAGLCLKEK